ncbi:MAG: ABC transporter permease [Bacteroidales bacterium]|nr:ABC transporter permease [Bacteroidales bacterium]
MKLHTIGIVIRREYLNRVKKKSFLVTTFVVPILMAALCIVPVVLMMNSKEKTKKIAVVDQSGIVMPYLEDNDVLNYTDCSAEPLDSVKAYMAARGFDGVLHISELNDEKSVSADFTSQKPVGMSTTEMMNGRINAAVEAYRVSTYGIKDLDKIMKEIKSNVRINSFTRDEEGKEKISDASVNSILSMVLGIFIFIFITMFGAMVMSAVIEEKSSRVVEVLISSVKATELMFGKIIGIALVAFTQFLLWILLTGAIVGAAMGIILPKMTADKDPMEMVEAMSGMNPDMVNLPFATGNAEIDAVIGTLQGLNLGSIALYFVIFFILGYFLYASLYAAIGSAVENEGDTQQLQLPVTIPLMLAYFIALYAFNAPDSSIAVWGSLIPFTSPIVMLARIPFHVPAWQIILSIALLALTTFGCAWLSAKIYKVGILMFGKKSTFKDLWKWLKMK